MKKPARITMAMFAVLLLSTCILYINNDLGIPKSKLEADARSSQRIDAEWLCESAVSDSMAAFICYPEDKTDHTFSLYVNRPGISFGYFFRAGGDLTGYGKYISDYRVEGFNQRAFISMNEVGAVRLEIDDGNTFQTIPLEANKPFALILPINAGSVIFYNANDKPIETIIRNV